MVDCSAPEMLEHVLTIHPCWGQIAALPNDQIERLRELLKQAAAKNIEAMSLAICNVCFAPESGQGMSARRCPLSAKSSRQQSEGVFRACPRMVIGTREAKSCRFTGPWTESSYCKYCSIGASPTVTKISAP